MEIPMSSLLNSDLAQFRDFLNAKLSSGECAATPEQALDEFRGTQYSDEEFEDSVAAVRESLAEIESGAPGKLASDHLAEVRARYGWNK
jgi:hypothetical protein